MITEVIAIVKHNQGSTVFLKFKTFKSTIVTSHGIDLTNTWHHVMTSTKTPLKLSSLSNVCEPRLILQALKEKTCLS